MKQVRWIVGTGLVVVVLASVVIGAAEKPASKNSFNKPTRDFLGLLKPVAGSNAFNGVKQMDPRAFLAQQLGGKLKSLNSKLGPKFRGLGDSVKDAANLNNQPQEVVIQHGGIRPTNFFRKQFEFMFQFPIHHPETDNVEESQPIQEGERVIEESAPVETQPEEVQGQWIWNEQENQWIWSCDESNVDTAVETEQPFESIVEGEAQPEVIEGQWIWNEQENQWVWQEGQIIPEETENVVQGQWVWSEQENQWIWQAEEPVAEGVEGEREEALGDWHERHHHHHHGHHEHHRRHWKGELIGFAVAGVACGLVLVSFKLVSKVIRHFICARRCHERRAGCHKHAHHEEHHEVGEKSEKGTSEEVNETAQYV